MWLCPWCFVSPFTPPKAHKSLRNSRTLQTTVLCDAISAQLEVKMEAMLDKKLDNNSKEVHQKLATLADAPLPATAADIAAIQTQLKDLQEAMDSSKHPPKQQHPCQAPPTPSPQIECTAPPPLVTSHHKPVESFKDNYISDDTSKQILEYLDNVVFHKEGQRQTKTYGKKYKYLGSKNIDPEPLPEILKPILDRLNDDIKGQVYKYKLNQCLINKYPSGSSTLPQHSDDEASIDPNSSIFTISVGAERSIVFVKKSDKSKSTHIAKNGSLYEMTQNSQNHFTHGIGSEDQHGVRYSLTFRRVHWTNFNSTLLYGDSNFAPIEMGKGRGKVGKSTPGLRRFAAKVEDINPNVCESYQNIVCMFGTNNLKDKKMTEDGVLETYKLYKGKLEQIRSINPKCKLLVCPVLPTRLASINKHILCFNKYIVDDLSTSKLDVHIVWGLDEFVDYQSGVLKNSLCGPHWEGDPLHLNLGGTKLLVKLLKDNIFSLRRSKRLSPKVDGRSYMSVVDSSGTGSRRQVSRWANHAQVPSYARRGHS